MFSILRIMMDIIKNALYVIRSLKAFQLKKFSLGRWLNHWFQAKKR